MNLYGTVLKRINQFFSSFRFSLPSGEYFILTKPKERNRKPIFKSLSQQLQFQKQSFEQQPDKQYVSFFHSHGNREECNNNLIINKNTSEIDASSLTKNNITFNVNSFDSRGHINNNTSSLSKNNNIIFSTSEEKNKRLLYDNQLQIDRDSEEKRILTLRGNDINKTISEIANEEVSSQYKILAEAVGANTIKIDEVLKPTQETGQSSSLISEGKKYINSKDQETFYLLDTTYTIRDDKILILNFENNNSLEEPQITQWPQLPDFPVPILDGFTVYGKVTDSISNLLEVGLRNIHGITSGLNFYNRPSSKNTIIIDFDKDENGNIIYQKGNNGKVLEGALIGKTNSQLQLELFFNKNYYEGKGENI